MTAWRPLPPFAHVLPSQHSSFVQVRVLHTKLSNLSLGITFGSLSQSLASHLSLSQQHSDSSFAQVRHFVEPSFGVNADPHVTAWRPLPPFAQVFDSQQSFVVHVLALHSWSATLATGTRFGSAVQTLGVQVITRVRHWQGSETACAGVCGLETDRGHSYYPHNHGLRM